VKPEKDSDGINYRDAGRAQDMSDDTTLRHRLIEFIGTVKPNGALSDDTSLIRSGLFDSLALVQMVEWIERQIRTEVDLTAFDLSKEWDTIPAILRFIERHRAELL
jgi:acyl carrier protein